MKIVVISTLWERTPPPLYGGTERIASYITEELVRRGHDVTLFATGDSKTRAKLISVYPRPLYRDKVPWTSYHDSLVSSSKAMEYAEKNKADIIHSHNPYSSLPFTKLVKVPLVHTIHGNIGSDEIPPEKQRLLRAFRYANFVSISDSQRKIKELNYIATVYNGIPIDSFKFNAHGGDYLLWVGRITPKKGLDEAITVAHQLGKKLLIAAKLDWAVKADMEYFENTIKARLKKGVVEYLGEADQVAKNKLFGNARLLLNPIKWDEPFGLVPVEANACGTPVVTFGRGSMPEIIKDGVNGFLVKPGDINAMVEAAQEIYALPPDRYQALRQSSRQHVEENFTVEKMVNGYEAVYKKLTHK